MKIFALAAFVAVSASLAAAQSGAGWTYDGKTGPINWGKLDPAYKTCEKGHAQSPIDIRGAHLNKTLAPIEFHYVAGGVTVTNTGHAIGVDVHPGSYIVVAGQRYDLTGFEFHQPAEEPVRGKLADLGVHLVHRSADGKLAILAVRFSQDQDTPNALLATLWPHLPQKPDTRESVAEMINPGGLLPADRGYWTYTGSLTEPPCTEGVRWIVFEQQMTISRSQYRLLASLYRLNSRPVQPTHGRRIEANE